MEKKGKLTPAEKAMTRHLEPDEGYLTNAPLLSSPMFSIRGIRDRTIYELVDTNYKKAINIRQ